MCVRNKFYTPPYNLQLYCVTHLLNVCESASFTRGRGPNRISSGPPQVLTGHFLGGGQVRHWARR